MSKSYGLGGTEVKTDAGEAIQEIDQNKTLFVQKLTQAPPVKPDVVRGLKDIDSVFQHFSPEVDIEFEDQDGQSKKETLRFENVGHFGKKGIVDQSVFLKNLDAEKKQYLKIVKQLRSNKILKKALENPEAKQAFLESIQALLAELKSK